MPNLVDFEKIKHYVATISGVFEYSLSGANKSIVRETHGHYKMPEWSRYMSIQEDIGKFDLISAFEKMIKYKIADCCEQAQFLAMFLQLNDSINQNYKVLIVSTNESERKDVSHSFLALIPRESSLKFDHNKSFLELYGRDLLDQDNIIILDPWRNIVFQSGMTVASNPMTFIPNLNVNDTKFIYQNLDLVWLAAQTKFKKIVNDIKTESTNDVTSSVPLLEQFISKFLLMEASSQKETKTTPVLVSNNTTTVAATPIAATPIAAQSAPTIEPQLFSSSFAASPIEFRIFLSDYTQACRHGMKDNQGRYPCTEDYWNNLPAHEKDTLRTIYRDKNSLSERQLLP